MNTIVMSTADMVGPTATNWPGGRNRSASIAGIDAYDPASVPPATDAPAAYDPELDENPFPPTHYDE